MRRVIFTALLGASVAGCGGSNNGLDSPAPKSQQVNNQIALCAAGRTVTLSAGLEADLAKFFDGQASLSAEARNDLRGAFFEGADPNNPNAVRAYEAFLSCVERVRL